MRNTILFLLFVVLQSLFYTGFAQTTDPCKPQEPQEPPKEYPLQPGPESVDSADVLVVNPVDPNEIVGIDGYDAMGRTDTFRWVSATQSLAYTIYFENNAELAMAAASKVTITVPLHKRSSTTPPLV